MSRAYIVGPRRSTAWSTRSVRVCPNYVGSRDGQCLNEANDAMAAAISDAVRSVSSTFSIASDRRAPATLCA